MTRAIKGRGALSNPPGRFDRFVVEPIEGEEHEVAPAPHILTAVEPDHARTLITYSNSPDVPFDRSINPYRGCEHGCIYCYARPSHGYLGLSPGLDFETRLFYKADAARLLETDLAKPGYVCRPIALGTNTDPYQPIEKHFVLTRGILQVLLRCRHPVTIVTKGALILRDIDLLAELAGNGLASVMISLTTLDARTKRTLEPRAASPQTRLKIIRQLAEVKVPVGVMVAPVIPAITDHELERILESGADAGATSAAYILLRLPYEVGTLFREWLDEHHPLKARHVMSLVRSLRGGRDNDPRFGTRMRGQGPFAELLHRRFAIARQRFGLDQDLGFRLATGLFVPPHPSSPQLDLAL